MAEDTKPAKGDNDELLHQARELFERAASKERENRDDARDDIRFARLGEQWPAEVRKQRERDGRPCLTINKLPAVIRQVVNDARQNRPAIKVHPVDDKADPQTAEVMNGLIRNIEYTSDADVAYDTALEFAVTCGFGYFRINTEYSCDDTFEQDLRIEAVPNPFTVYGDPDSTAADSSDWNVAFVTEVMPKTEFERRYKDADPVDWASGGYGDLNAPWCDDETVMVAEWWERKKVQRAIVGLSDGQVVGLKEYEADPEKYGAEPIGKPRLVMSYKVTQRIMTGAEVLETVEWPGKYIPIVPVYGEDLNVEGKRVLRSLVRDAKDPQRMFNYWRTTATEMVALAPKSPFIGPVKAFETDAEKWATANTKSHAFIEYDGAVPPQRQPFPAVPAGALQEALNASDDIKAITGIHDASLGARSNETSGRAIMARQREGDVSTFHFIDNLSRSIRHAGRVLIDLIPKVYSTARIVRVLGADPKEAPVNVPVNQQVQQQDENGQPVFRIYDLTAGKYDLTVTAGPSFTTKRQEAAEQMTEFVRAYPASAPIIGDLVAKNLDWPGADEIARRLQAMLPAQIKGEQAPDPEKQQMQQVIQQGMARLQQLQQENEQLKADRAESLQKAENDARKLDIEAYRAETERMQVTQQPQQPTELPGAPDDATSGS